MQFTYKVNFRKFNSHSERRDSGTYNGLNEQRKANINIKNTDNALEQILTFFHEATHSIIDLLFEYDLRKKGITQQRKKSTKRDEWEKLNKKVEIEEKICKKVEKAVKRILQKDLPPEVFDHFFKDQ